MGAATIITGAISLFSTMQQQGAQKDAAKSEKKRVAAEKASQEAAAKASALEASRARIKEVREARIRKAQVLSAAGNSGMELTGTSGVVGSVGSIGTQAASNIGYINTKEGIASTISTENINAAAAQSSIFSAQAKAAQWQAIGGLAKSAFDATGGFTTIFGGNTHKGSK